MNQYEQVVQEIGAEYPELAKLNLEVVRQFSGGVDRLSNTYLVQSNSRDESLKQFVAKGAPAISGISSIVTEWWALTTLMRQVSVAAPTVLFPEHQPRDFLLLEYLPGTNADEAIRAGEAPEPIFRLIGEALAALHSVPVSQFGTPKSLLPNWPWYVRMKLDERLKGTGQLVDPALTVDVRTLMEKLQPALDQEVDQPPVLIHRDTYTTNVILSPDRDRAALIDFGLAIGGRPFFDFGKLVVNEPTRPLIQTRAFLDGYGLSSKLSSDQLALINLYVLLELLGQIPFFHRIGSTNYRDSACETLRVFVGGLGLNDSLQFQELGIFA